MEAHVRKVIAASNSPAFEPLTLAEVKAHLRLAEGSVDHDQYCLDAIKRAREEFEAMSNIVIAQNTFSMAIDDWPAGDFIELPIRPVTSIASVTYTVVDSGSTQTLSASKYLLDNYAAMPRVVIKNTETWPSNRGYHSDVVITFVAGYANRAAVPNAIKHALLVDIDRRFEKRGSEDEKSTSSITFDSLTGQFQRQTYP